MTNLKNNTQLPDRLFEVSWEVCNKVGGIHTVLATKANSAVRIFGDRYVAIGPDIHREDDNGEFVEDAQLLADWRRIVYDDGIRIRIGRWQVPGAPIAVLVDFSPFFNRKDDILKFLWEAYRVDSISGQWDYIEPVLFGYAAGRVIESYCKFHCSPQEKSAVHFHEWMTASGGLYLRRFSPYIATLFSTHATVVGRTLAGNGLPLYGTLAEVNADETAHRFNVVAKHSLEKIAAHHYDCFCTVSDITAQECRHLLDAVPDQITPNGFENGMVWGPDELDVRRTVARRAIISVAQNCLEYEFRNEPLIAGTSGRYEFHNKGIDVFIRALARLADTLEGDREILACIAVPAGNDGPRTDIMTRMQDPSAPLDRNVWPPFVTHYLSAPDWDPVSRAVEESGINRPDSRVKLIFVPSYLDGSDGIFNMHYYELLAGMDVTVFASYYEPWGYTPLESAAFSVPTVTTTLAGFGLWVDRHSQNHRGVEVIARSDYDDEAVVTGIATILQRYAVMAEGEYEECRQSARQISLTALWDKLIQHYLDAYDKALHAAAVRNRHAVYDESPYVEQASFVRQQLSSNRPTWRRLMVEVALPERLKPLEELSKNLWWTWTLDGQELYEMIDPELWDACRHNPAVFLDRLSTRRIELLAHDTDFLEKMDSVYSKFQEYMSGRDEQRGPHIAYFSMEYGLANYLKIYSGGLGILAGDYLKEASDRNIAMTGVGLLYRYGYFTQKISSGGVQEASYEAQEFNKLPISPVRDEEGRWLSVRISFPGRVVTARIWQCHVGRVELYLLDTDHDLNCPEDRTITHYLYGGDNENRLRQEIVLGIGGIRALELMNITADVFHCNEGHAAFTGIERINSLIKSEKLSFSEALEVVRSSSLFTTHTPVPAGHDAFAESLLRQYMSHYPDRLGITWEQFINLGKTNPYDNSEKFSMSVLASNLSQEINGVSWLHGEVSRKLLGDIWPGYFHGELHIGHVTNGVHLPTWTASGLRRLYMKYFPEGVSSPAYDQQSWVKVHDIPDEELWAERLKLKTKLTRRMKRYYQSPEQSLMTSPQNMVRLLESFETDMLTIGFARRFATYKRANLLLSDPARLSAILNNPTRPVRLVFAGKAHPNDIPGQDLIKRIVEISKRPEFSGRIMFLANYDMDTARRMVQGVDVWLNTPMRPQEASGTSGMKAALNGVMQFSVLDGWWVEGYREGAGWALPMNRTYEDQQLQDELDAALVYRTIEEEIAPLYYDRDADGVPHRWIEAMKRCIAEIGARFTTNRMLADYEAKYYDKLWRRSTEMKRDSYDMARRTAAWKRRISAAWDSVKIVDIKQFDVGSGAIMVNTAYRIEATVDIGTLNPDDIGVELIIADQIEPGGNVKILDCMELQPKESHGSLVRYAVNSIPTYSGSFDVALRVYPHNPLLPHRMDFALVKWA